MYHAITKFSPMKKLKIFLTFTIFALIAFQAQAQDEAMNYTELQTYLPSTLSGYTADKPDGSSINMQGMAFSSAEIMFTNASGDEVHITLVDYSQAINMYQAATAMFSSGMSFEDNDSKAWSVEWSDDIAGWEEIDKKNNEVQITLGIGSGFFLTIEATNKTDIHFVEDIAKSMKLEQLAGK